MSPEIPLLPLPSSSVRVSGEFEEHAPSPRPPTRCRVLDAMERFTRARCHTVNHVRPAGSGGGAKLGTGGIVKKTVARSALLALALGISCAQAQNVNVIVAGEIR